MRRNALPIFIFVMLALVVYGIISLNKKSGVAENKAEEDIVVEAPTPPSQMSQAVQNSAQNNGNAQSGTSAVAPVSSGGGAPQTTAADVGHALEQMSKCLGLDAAQFDPSSEPTVANFQASLPYDLGMVLFEENDWTAKDIRLPNGEQRRLMIQYLPASPGGQRKNLHYLSVQNGEQIELPLEEEQKNNPSDSLLASLEMDGEVYSQSASKKAYLQHGGEVHMMETQGVLSSFELSVDGRSFRCSNNLKNCDCP